MHKGGGGAYWWDTTVQSLAYISQLFHSPPAYETTFSSCDWL